MVKICKFGKMAVLNPLFYSGNDMLNGLKASNGTPEIPQRRISNKSHPKHRGKSRQ
jgi:hypothetical protein